MKKVKRTVDLDEDNAKGLDKLNTRHGDIRYHINKALRSYLKRKRVLGGES